MSDTTTETRFLAEALKGLRFAMVGTADGPIWRSRPLTLAEQEGDVLRFLVTNGAEWVEALESGGSPATVTFSDPHKNVFVALQGRAHVRHDRGPVERLWNPAAASYFEGKDDPAIRVLEFVAEDGEYWDGPSGRVGQMISLVRAALGGQPGTKGHVLT